MVERGCAQQQPKVIEALDLNIVLGELEGVGGDQEVFRANAGVRPAGTVVHDHFVCAKCSATKRDVLAGDPFLKWNEHLPLGDLLPGVAVDMRGQCPPPRDTHRGVTAVEPQL